MNPERLAAAYGVPGVIAYDRDPAGGLVIATGAGMMLAAMDQLTTAEWCVDLGGGRANDQRTASWIEAASYTVPWVAVVAWFTVTRPDNIADAIRRCACPTLWVSNIDLGVPGRYPTVDDLAREVAP